MYSNALKNKISKLFRVGLTVSEVSKAYPEIPKEILCEIKKESETEKKIEGQFSLIIALIKNNAVELLKTRYEEKQNDAEKFFSPIHNNIPNAPYNKNQINKIKWIFKMIDEKRLTLNSTLDIKDNLKQHPNELNSNIIMARIYQYFGLDDIAIGILNAYNEQLEFEQQKQKVNQAIEKVKNNQEIDLPVIAGEPKKTSYKKTQTEIKTQNEPIKYDKQIISEIRNLVYDNSITIINLNQIKKEVNSIKDKTLAAILLCEIYENLGMNDLRN